MDGGAADAIPTSGRWRKGCERVIVVLTRERSYVRRPEKLQPLIDAAYRKYPRFCDTMRRRADAYNTSRERLFQLEREGRASCSPPTARRAFTAPKRTWRRFGRCGRTAMTRAWSGWTRCRTS